MKESIKDRNSEVNKLQGEYLSSSLNQVWTVDITIIKQKYYFFFILDLASRRIVYHDVSQHDYTSAEAIYVFEKALTLENSVEPPRPVKYVHTDSAGIFVSKEWMEFLAVNEISPSSADSKKNQNQVSERFNRTFKKILRDRLNVMLNKRNNKTSTFQLIGEATKYNFENLKKLTEELIVYYNSEKPHDHLNDLPPDTWASQARSLPDQTHIFKEKKVLSEEGSDVVIDVSEEKELNNIDTLRPEVSEQTLSKHSKEDVKGTRDKMLDLSKCEIIPFVPLSKNDNSEEARIIRKYKHNVGNLELIKSVKEKRIDLSQLDPVTQKIYKGIEKETEYWKETDIRYLETIVLQNQILLSNIEELKEKTNELKLQNEELLDMNHYLVETAQKAEETQRLILERKQKRQASKKLQKRDYISVKEFFEIVFKIVYKCEDSRYISSRNRIAFYIMYFTGLRVSNLLVLTVRNIKELMYDKLGSEIRIIKGGRCNQLISLGDDAQRLLITDFFEDIATLLKDKNDDDPVFTSENNNKVALHRVTFTQNLNRTLKYASEEFHKKITCHSFRVTFIKNRRLK